MKDRFTSKSLLFREDCLGNKNEGTHEMSDEDLVEMFRANMRQ